MYSLNTVISSDKLKVIGTRICETCGSEVKVISTSFAGKDMEVSQCLACESKRIEDECNRFFAEQKKRKAAEIFERYSFISDDLKEATFDNYVPDHESKVEAKKKAMWYASNFEKIANKQYDFQSLLFIGGFGLGKSHLAYSIAEAVKQQGYTTIFMDTPSLLRVIRESYDKNSKFTESEILEACFKADLLVLDDIGAEYVKNDGSESWATDKLFQVIYSRMGKPTIYTTNYNASELIDKYGQPAGGRIVSRMMKGTKVVKFDGEDYRTRGF